MHQFIRKIVAVASFVFLCPTGVGASEIQIQTLSDFSLSSYGTHALTYPDLWEKSDKMVVYELLDKIATRSLKQSEKEILVRLLTADTGPFIWSDVQNSDAFLIKRMQTLFDIGAFEAVYQTVQSIALTQRSQALSTLLFDALLMNGQIQEACALLDDKEPVLNIDERRISCLLAQNKMAEASLQYELYRENKQDESSFTKLGDYVFRGRPFKVDLNQPVLPETILLWIVYGQVPTENQKAWVREAVRHLKPELIKQESPSKSENEKSFSRADLLKLIEMTPEMQAVYPMDLYRALGQAAAQERRGEAVLWGVLLLSQSDFYRPEITTLMVDMMGQKTEYSEQNEQTH